jgi:hypothetical protein
LEISVVDSCSVLGEGFGTKLVSSVWRRF